MTVTVQCFAQVKCSVVTLDSVRPYSGLQHPDGGPFNVTRVRWSETTTLLIPPTNRVHAAGAKEGTVGSVGTAFYTAWLDVASEGLTISKVTGNHLSMVQQPHVQQVALKLTAFTSASA